MFVCVSCVCVLLNSICVRLFVSCVCLVYVWCNICVCALCMWQMQQRCLQRSRSVCSDNVTTNISLFPIIIIIIIIVVRRRNYCYIIEVKPNMKSKDKETATDGRIEEHAMWGQVGGLSEVIQKKFPSDKESKLCPFFSLSPPLSHPAKAAAQIDFCLNIGFTLATTRPTTQWVVLTHWIDLSLYHFSARQIFCLKGNHPTTHSSSSPLCI